MKHFFKSRRALCVVASALAFLAIGCSGGGESEKPSLVSITAETTKDVYLKGEALDPDTITVTGTYSDGNAKPLTIRAGDISGYDPNKAGSQTITVTVEGKTAAFTVTVTEDPGKAKEVLTEAMEAAVESMQEIVVSADGKGVPQGVKWVTAGQKKPLDDALAAAQDLTASATATVEELAAALGALEAAAEEMLALAETQTGAETSWSYTVDFDSNGGDGENPASISVATPDTTAGDLPVPVRSGYVFSGWNTGADGTGSAFAGTTPVTADITVYAQWTALVNARAPVISVQPQNAAYIAGASAAALTVTAASPDGGSLSYQWYSGTADGGTAIAEATAASYTPPTGAVGAVSYYVRVTNTNNNADGTKTAAINSNTATVTITALVNAQAPDISVQPRSAAYTVGATAAALTVTAASPDGGSLSYQWYSGTAEEGTAIAEATAASYTPPTVSVGAVSYYARVTNTNNNAGGTKTAEKNSDTATITITALVNAQAPNISVQPQSAAYTVGATAAALTVTAASPDGGSLSYQWFRSADQAWAAIDSATGSSYLPSTTAAGAVAYYVQVTNTNNNASGTKIVSVSSNPVTVMVTVVNAQAPSINGQPQSAAYDVGAAAAALTVTARSPDGGVLSYQWHSRDWDGSEWGEGTAIDDATGPSYLPSTTEEGIVAYYVRVTNTNNALSGTKTAAANSEAATVTVVVNAKAPVITTQPLGAEYLRGAPAAALTVNAASPDGGALSYQWYRSTGSGWDTIPGATSQSYMPPTTTAGFFSYYLRVTNTNNSVSGVKTASVNSATAAVRIRGTGNITVAVWASDDGSLISDIPEELDISRSWGDSLTIVAADDLTDLWWSINGRQHSTAQSITIEAPNYPVGSYTLSLYAERDGVPYSITITFVVDN